MWREVEDMFVGTTSTKALTVLAICNRDGLALQMGSSPKADARSSRAMGSVHPLRGRRTGLLLRDRGTKKSQDEFINSPRPGGRDRAPDIWCRHQRRQRTSCRRACGISRVPVRFPCTTDASVTSFSHRLGKQATRHRHHPRAPGSAGYCERHTPPLQRAYLTDAGHRQLVAKAKTISARKPEADRRRGLLHDRSPLTLKPKPTPAWVWEPTPNHDWP